MVRLVQILTVGLALIVGLGFVGVYGWENIKAWKNVGQSSPPSSDHSTQNTQSLQDAKPDSVTGQAEDIKDPYTYVATILVGLVGGVVAVFFGQKISLQAFGWNEALSGFYALAYTVMGVFSVITWMFNARESVLVKTLALSFLGLLVPVVTSFFKKNSFTELMAWKRNAPETPPQ
jgi:hypothetical protein